MRNIITTLLVLTFFAANAQHVEVSSHTLVGNDGKLPFWLWANQLGRFDQNSDSQQNFELMVSDQFEVKETGVKTDWKVRGNFAINDETDFRLTELSAGFEWKIFRAQIGTWAEHEIYSGLSSSNGNLASSLNARPLPRVRAGFSRFVDIIPEKLSVYGFWEEGLLDDNRIVDDAHLHRKAFYLRTGTPQKLQFTAGLEHFVMWGGTHPQHGELPGFEEYLKYVTASAGGNLATDQLNALGNSYGTYQFNLTKQLNKAKIELYISHPFEDKSGMEFDNLKDNLYGVAVNLDKEYAFLKTIVIEYLYSMNQSGRFHLQERPDGTHGGRGRDDYFNNSVYSSGVTYEGLMMGAPLFGPVLFNENGESTGIRNNRIKALHIGAKGYLKQNLIWNLMVTSSKNYGRYTSPSTTSYTPARDQFSSLLSITWLTPKLPFKVKASAAYDDGQLYDNGISTSRWGGMLSIGYNFNL